MAELLLIILTVGLASQWLAWRINLPAIVVLIASGLMLGPFTGVIAPSDSPQALNALIGLGVAIILFEGGMDLKIRELRHTKRGIGRLVFVGPSVSWLLGAAAAHYVAGLSWSVAIVLAAILVVTGPTVIGPLLRQARLNKETSSLLKWEAIVNDPVGVLLAVISFQYFTHQGSEVTDSLLGLGMALSVGVIIGSTGGWLTGWLYHRGAVPVHLKAPILMVLVLVIYWASNLIVHEVGLLSVMVMGMMIGNMQLVERQALLTFQKDLGVVLLSVLFIVIPAQLELQHLKLIDWRAILFVLALMLLVRPLIVGLSTAFAPVRRADKLLLAWIAPRGIVAAATAGLFGPALVDAGYPDAQKLLPIMFLVVTATVLAHGLTIGPLARRLKLSSTERNGLLIVGASDFSLALALALRRLKIDVVISDGAWDRLKQARMDGVPVHYGEILSEESEHQLDVQNLSHLLCTTENDFYNALVCKAQAQTFDHHRAFQIAAHSESDNEFKRMSIDMRGYFSFANEANYTVLQLCIAEDWIIQSTKISESHGWEELKERLDKVSPSWLLLVGLTPKGLFRLYSQEQHFKPELGWTVIYFALPTTARNNATTVKVDAACDADDGNSTALAPIEGKISHCRPKAQVNEKHLAPVGKTTRQESDHLKSIQNQCDLSD